MEPNFPGNNIPNTSPETLPDSQFTAEQLPGAIHTPEAPISSPESSADAEQLPIDHVGQTVATSSASQVADVSTMPASVPVAPATPVVADDNDIIEREWVDKVKQIISSTGSDPYAQQSEASRLMADYVLKRFGKKVGEPEG